MIILEMFHGRISLILVLLLLLVNFVKGSRIELIYISLIENNRSSVTHLNSFQLIVLLTEFIEITFFVCTKKINVLILKQSSDMLVIAAKVLLKLPNLLMLIKKKSPLLSRSLALVTVFVMFSTKVNLLYLLYSTDQEV